jgi:hypothetical protein
MDFFDQAELGTHMGNGVVELLESWASQAAWRRARRRPYVARWAVRICAHFCAKVRESPRKSAKVRTDQARKSAIVRIFTGETNFSIRKAGNKENKNGKEGGLTTDGHE